MKTITLVSLFFFCVYHSAAQSNDELEAMAATPKTSMTFPVNYKINLPVMDLLKWEDDYQLYSRFTTPAVNRTQASISFDDNGVHTMMCPNGALPHAQLDTLTRLSNEAQLTGAWRMICHRSIRFVDSLSVPDRKVYRTDTLLQDNSGSEAFAFFEDGQYRIYAKEAGDTKFKRQIKTKYALENNRYLLFYKLARAGGSIAQAGIDENGYLILNFPAIIENSTPKGYIAYYAVIEQLILEKVK
jgi:hypothetical protein